MLDKLLNKNGDVIPGSEGFEPKQTHVDMFKRLSDRPNDARGMERGLLILSTPRCGSTLFCEALNNSRQLGIADEWLNYEYFAAWAMVLGLDEFNLHNYINWVARKTLRNTGVLVINWHIGQVISMNKDFGLSHKSMDFKRIVYLTRRDKIAQAVSLAKAVSTNQFRSYETAEGVADLSPSAIAKYLKSIVEFEAFAHDNFHEAIDFEWAYEDFKRTGHPSDYRAGVLREDPHESYKIIMGEFGGTPQDYYNTGALKKQGDDTNRRATDRFLKYITGESHYENG